MRLRKHRTPKKRPTYFQMMMVQYGLTLGELSKRTGYSADAVRRVVLNREQWNAEDIKLALERVFVDEFWKRSPAKGAENDRTSGKG